MSTRCEQVGGGSSRGSGRKAVAKSQAVQRVRLFSPGRLRFCRTLHWATPAEGLSLPSPTCRSRFCVNARQLPWAPTMKYKASSRSHSRRTGSPRSSLRKRSRRAHYTHTCFTMCLKHHLHLAVPSRARFARMAGASQPSCTRRRPMPLIEPTGESVQCMLSTTLFSRPSSRHMSPLTSSTGRTLRTSTSFSLRASEASLRLRIESRVSVLDEADVPVLLRAFLERAELNPVVFTAPSPA
jgi:hypothetical protein